MATKYLQILSTRSTVIGVFRFGVIYKFDDSDMRVAKVIKSLTNKGTKEAPKRVAAKLLTEQEAAAAKAEMESLVPPVEPVSAGGEDFEVVIAEIGERAKIAEAEAAALQSELDKADTEETRLKGELQDKEQAITAMQSKVEGLEANLNSAVTERETLLAEVKLKDQQLDDAAKEIATLKSSTTKSGSTKA